MDLLSTVYAPDWKSIVAKYQRNCTQIQPKWCFESATLCEISSNNTIVFTSNYPLVSASSGLNPDLPLRGFGSGHLAASGFTLPGVANTLCGVYVADLNTPWELHKVTARQSQVTALAWDNESGNSFVMSDESGQVEVWQMKELTEWTCVARTTLSSEKFVRAKFASEGRRTYLNLDKLDCPFKEKFEFRSPSTIARMFTDRNRACAVLVSSTGLVVMLSYDVDEGSDGHPCTVDNGKLMRSVKSLGATRQRIKLADIVFSKDGNLLVATSNGNPKAPLRCHSLHPELDDNAVEFGSNGMSLEIETFPGIFVNQDVSQDTCQAVVDLKFVVGDDKDSLVIATQHPSGGKVQLWELKEHHLQTNKVFLASAADVQLAAKKILVPKWEYAETFNGPPSQVICLSTCTKTFQTGRTAGCYVTVAYGDGSIQCLLRDSLQQIASGDMPKSGNYQDEPSSKISRCSVATCDMTFSANGNVLVVIDSLGQLYMYRMSPVSDPGGSHVEGNIVNMLESCLLSGSDWWDVTVCIKASQVESICSRLTDEFHQQQHQQNQMFLFNRCMAMKSSLFRLPLDEQTDYKAADCFAQLMLSSIHGVFKSLLRPSDITLSESILDKVSQLLQTKMKDELSLNKLAALLEQRSREFVVESGTLQSYQTLIQWTTNLACHIMASVPEYNQRKGPGMNLVNNRRVLNMLREMLLLIRLWSRICPGVKPNYTKTVESYDVIERLFHLITKFKESQLDESIHEECILLPSHVVIPPIQTVIRARGLAPTVVGLGQTAVAYEFGSEPDSLREDARNWVFIEGMQQENVAIDCVRQMYLGRNPPKVKACTRCSGVTTFNANSQTKSCLQGWENRWLRHCPCGGPWRVTHEE